MPRIIRDDCTFVTNNARDFRKLYARQDLHAGLIIVVPQVAPVRQRALLDGLLADLGVGANLTNEVIELEIDGDAVVINRYELPAT